MTALAIVTGIVPLAGYFSPDRLLSKGKLIPVHQLLTTNLGRPSSSELLQVPPLLFPRILPPDQAGSDRLRHFQILRFKDVDAYHLLLSFRLWLSMVWCRDVQTDPSVPRLPLPRVSLLTD